MPLSLLFSFHWSFWKRESEQRTAASENEELPAIHFVGDWRVSHPSDRRVPQRRTIARSERHRIPRYIAGEGKTGSGRQHSRGRSAIAERVIPLDLPCLIIDCPEKSFAGHVVIGSSPAVFAVLRLEKINAVTVLCAHDE